MHATGSITLVFFCVACGNKGITRCNTGSRYLLNGNFELAKRIFRTIDSNIKRRIARTKLKRSAIEGISPMSHVRDQLNAY